MDRIVLSQFTIFKDFLLEIINGNNENSFKAKDVKEGIREYFKRRIRGGVKSDNDLNDSRSLSFDSE